jgi:hypothetical protein
MPWMFGMFTAMTRVVVLMRSSVLPPPGGTTTTIFQTLLAMADEVAFGRSFH